MPKPLEPTASDLLALHGTTTTRAVRIMREGLRAGSYLCESLDLAGYYASEAVDADQAGVEALIEVLAPKAALRLDSNAMNEPVMTGELRRDQAWHQAAGDHPDWLVDGYIRVPPEAWQVSWEGVGSVRTATPIESTRLRLLKNQ